MTTQEAARLLWEENRAGRPFPSQLRGIASPDEGYHIQLEMLALQLAAGELQAGWKVGLTAKATQDYLGFHERIFGHMLQSGELACGAAHDFSRLKEPLFEPELCVVMGEALRGPGVTIAQARAAIAGAAPAVEVVEVRAVPGDGLPVTLADNSAHRAYIMGALTSPLDAGLALQATTTEIHINGEPAERAGGHEVMDGPEGSVAWLANKLAVFGRRLEPGQKVMTGSFTKPYPIESSGRIECRFDPFGTVSFQVA